MTGETEETWEQATLRRYEEALALDHVEPMRLIEPESRDED